MSQAPVQLVGVGPEPVTVALHGNRRLLVMQPETVHLEIRQTAKRKMGVGGPQQAAGQNAHWRPYTGRLYPDAVDHPSPTIFSQCVYHCFQHGMLALLLWLHRGSEDQGPLLQIQYVSPATATGSLIDHFPFIVADATTVVLADDVEHRPLFLRVTNLEPSPGELVALTKLLQQQQSSADACWGCLVLVGTLRPAVLGHSQSSPQRVQLHGVLIRADRVEHGWYACVRQGRLWFTSYQRVGLGDDTGHDLSLLPLPHLPSVNLRLWRKGQATFAIGPVRSITTTDTQSWDTLLCHQLLTSTPVV